MLFTCVIAMFQPQLSFLSKYLYSGVIFHVLQAGEIKLDSLVIILLYLLALSAISLYFYGKYIIQNISK